jgi:hypothetical protein
MAFRSERCGIGPGLANFGWFDLRESWLIVNDSQPQRRASATPEHFLFVSVEKSLRSCLLEN